MADIIVTRNDTGFDIEFTVTDADGAAFDLTDYTIVFHMADKAYNPKASGSCTITDAEAGLCKYTVASGDLNVTPGTYIGELEMTTGAKKITSGQFTIQVTNECG